MTVTDELQARALFEQRYGIAAAPLLRQIERRVIGGDWGANGYTTKAQADQLASGLGLSAADRLLEVGTGRGWPGLHWPPAAAAGWSWPTFRSRGYGWPPLAPKQKALRQGRAGWWPPPAGCRSTPAALTPSSTPTCCADCAPSSPC